MEELLLKAVDEAKATSTRILLVLDGIDFLLAATEITVYDLLDCVTELREVCMACAFSARAPVEITIPGTGC